MKNFRVYLRNGTEIKIKAERYRFSDDRYAVHFYKNETEIIQDVFVYAGEVAAILPDKQSKNEPTDNPDR